MKTREYLSAVGYDLGDADSRGCIGECGGIEFFIRDRRMIPLHLTKMYDAGLTGYDLILHSGLILQFELVASLCFSRKTTRPTRWVLAGKTVDIDEIRRRRSSKLRIGCELTGIAPPLLHGQNIQDYELVPLEGDEEQAVDDDLCDLVLCVTETGGALRRAGLTMLPGCEELLVSKPRIFTRKDMKQYGKREALNELTLSLQSAVEAKSHVLVSCDIEEKNFPRLTLPSAVAPSSFRTTKEGWIAFQICIERQQYPRVLRLISEAGGKATILQSMEGYLP
jgi:ATP phosphoribosyltransferase